MLLDIIGTFSMEGSSLVSGKFSCIFTLVAKLFHLGVTYGFGKGSHVIHVVFIYTCTLGFILVS